LANTLLLEAQQRLRPLSSDSEIVTGRRTGNAGRVTRWIRPGHKFFGRPTASEQMLVSFSRQPFGAREMAIESTSRPLGMLVRVNVQHDQRDLAPVGTFRLGIQRPWVSMLLTSPHHP
jgi:hypothetical protein